MAGFEIVDRVFNHTTGDNWYRVEVNSTNISYWLTKQPVRLWVMIEFTGTSVSYTINEELYTLLQLTWGDQ